MSPPDPLPVLVLVQDLIFATRISATARSAGVAVKMLRDAAALAREPGKRLIVDLSLPGAIEAAAEWRENHQGMVIGFVSHVDAATIHQARAAGFDQVLPRSQFVRILPELLRGTEDAGTGVAD